MRKGQVTLIIILAVFITIILSITLFMRNLVQEKTIETARAKTVKSTVDLGSVRSYTEACLSMVSRVGLDRIAQYAGHLNGSPEARFGEAGAESISYNSTLIPYGIRFGTVVFPTMQDTTEALRRYVLVSMADCLNFTKLEERNYNITSPGIDFASIGFDWNSATVSYSETPLNVSITAAEQATEMTLQYPLLVSYKLSTSVLDSYRASQSIPLRRIHANFTALLQEINAAADSYDLSVNCGKFMASQISIVNSSLLRFTTGAPDSMVTYQAGLDHSVVGGCP